MGQVVTFFFVLLAFLIYRFLSPPVPGQSQDFVHILNGSYDYIVVGSGSAGSVVAHRLSEDNDVTILLLEAGGDDRDYEVVKSSFENTKAVIDPRIARSLYSEPQVNAMQGLLHSRSHCPRGMVLGGTASVNGMMYVRGSRHDYDRWANHTGDSSWDYSHVLPYFIKSEGMTEANLQPSAYHGTAGPQKISHTGKGSTMARKIVEAFQEAGYPYNEDYNGKTMEGIAYAQANIQANQRCSSAMAFVHPILHRKNLHVSLYSFVQKVVFDQTKRAVGVVVIKNNKKIFVRAKKEVILSAGAIQTPQILMLSGVGPKGHLDQLGIPVVADLPVGQNLQDHLLFYMPITVTAPWFNPEGTHAQENLLFTSTTDQTRAMDWPDLEVHFLSRIVDRDAMKNYLNFEDNYIDDVLPHREQSPYGLVCAPSLLRPASRGNLTLRSTDPYDDPVLWMNYLDKDEDLELLLRGVDVCKAAVHTKTMQAGGARLADPMPLALCRDHAVDSPAYWRCHIKVTLLTIYHHSGTCAMGAQDDPSAVVDSQLKVKVVKGLRVVDASIMPFVTSANTHAPTTMIGEKGADLIRGREPLPPISL